MAITEGLMQLGDFEIRLKPQTPLAVRRAIELYDSVVVTPARLAVAGMVGSDIINYARWRGVICEETGNRDAIKGAGMHYYLTYPGVAEPGPTLPAAWDWSDYLLEMESNHDCFTYAGLTQLAVVDEPATTWPDTSSDSSNDLPAQMWDQLIYLAGVLGTEFYVTPDNDFHSGGAGSANLFRVDDADITCVLAPDAGGGDAHYRTLPVTDWGVTRDVWDDADHFVVRNPGVAIVESYAARSLYAGKASGTGSRRSYFEISSTIDNTADGEKRGEALAAERVLRRTVEVQVDAYDIGRSLRPGDWLWAFDPIRGVIDTANQIWHGGVPICPEKLRLYSMTWPVEEGMGVYLLERTWSTSPVILDLTPYVEFEDQATSLEVDAPRRAALA